VCLCFVFFSWMIGQGNNRITKMLAPDACFDYVRFECVVLVGFFLVCGWKVKPSKHSPG